MPPVRIKYYGVIWMTRSTYVTATVIAAIIAGGLFTNTYLNGYLAPFRWPWDPVLRPDAVGLAGWFYNHFYDVILVCLLAEGIDILVTLRSFARKEAEQRGSSPDAATNI